MHLILFPVFQWLFLSKLEYGLYDLLSFAFVYILFTFSVKPIDEHDDFSSVLVWLETADRSFSESCWLSLPQGRLEHVSSSRSRYLKLVQITPLLTN